VREATEEKMSASGTVMLSCAPSSVAAARRWLTSELVEVGATEPAVADAALIASELLTNALRHARPLPGGKLRLGWALDGGVVELTVTDGGAATQPRAGWPSASSLGGRGLAIVSRLSLRWGASAGEAGTTVWAVLGAGEPEHALPAAGAGARLTAG
jgi:anti-sigma regulatory factor (Ser/Thr protein kinase)